MQTLRGTIPAPSVLAQLRALADESVTTLDELRVITRQQATLLGSLLTGPITELPEQIAQLIPSIHIDYRTDIPLPGLSFWARPHWYIHMRGSDPMRLQVITILHELKRIIDHPLRARLGRIGGEEWQALAMQFADDVCSDLALQYKLHQERRD